MTRTWARTGTGVARNGDVFGRLCSGIGLVLAALRPFAWARQFLSAKRIN